MIRRCKSGARAGMGQVGSEIYVAALIYLVVPIAFSRLITINLGGMADELLTSSNAAAYLYNRLSSVQMAYLVICAIVAALISLMLDYGFTLYTLKTARYEGVNLGDLFVGFRTFGRVLGANIIIGIKNLGWALITFLPIFASGVLLVRNAAMYRIEALLTIYFFFILALLPFMFISYRYSQTFRILMDDPDISPWAAVKLSVKMMKGHNLSYFWLHVSFFGWSILEGMTNGITGIYSKPYLFCAEAVFYDEISAPFAEKFDLGGYGDSGRRFEKTKQDFDDLM